MKKTAVAPRFRSWYDDVPRDTRGSILAGTAICLAFVGGFGAWAATAPISGAVVAPGAFVATGQNKIIQSMEGGIISRLLVKEGDIVSAGQPLVRLDGTSAKTELRRLVLRETRLRAIEARLIAEATAKSSLMLPISYDTEETTTSAALIDNQRLAFEMNRRTTENEVGALEQSISSLKEHILGTNIQLQAVTKEQELYQEEIESKQGLFQKGLVKKSEMLALIRAKTAMDGEIGRLTGDLGDTKDKIARTREQIAGVRNAVMKTATEHLIDVRGDLYDTRERIRTARKVADRVEITAPVRGAVIKLGYHTPGGVIEPGKPVMEILPLNDELLIEARVRPQDIDNVKNGADASVRLTAMSARVTPMVSGKVVYVSADSIQEDPRLDRSSGVYLARVKIDTDQRPLIKGFVATPGMPAEVYIKTGERTFLGYLMRPLRDSMARAFREK